jgi:hypothetical protein
MGGSKSQPEFIADARADKIRALVFTCKQHNLDAIAIKSMSKMQWGALAQAARVNAPSEQTQERVVDTLIVDRLQRTRMFKV